MAKARTLNEQIQADLRGATDPVNGLAEELGLYIGERSGQPVTAIFERNVTRFDPEQGEMVVAARESYAWLNPADFDCDALRLNDVAVLHNQGFRVTDINRNNKRLWRLRLRLDPELELEEFRLGTHTPAYP